MRAQCDRNFGFSENFVIRAINSLFRQINSLLGEKDPRVLSLREFCRKNMKLNEFSARILPQKGQIRREFPAIEQGIFRVNKPAPPRRSRPVRRPDHARAALNTVSRSSARRSTARIGISSSGPPSSAAASARSLASPSMSSAIALARRMTRPVRVSRGS